MNVTVKIQPVGRPHISNRIYSEEILQRICDQNKVYYGGMIEWNFAKHSFKSVPTNEMSHQVTNLRLEDGWLVGDVNPLCSGQGVALVNLMRDNLVGFRMAGLGGMASADEVSYYNLHFIHACNLEEERQMKEQQVEL